MSDNAFEDACDRLSHSVDGVQFERVRWARHEGPMLECLVKLAQETVAQRPDFELTDEGSKGAAKRFVLKVHGTRVVAITLALEEGKVIVWAEAIERSKHRIVNGRRHVAEFAEVDARWMADCIGSILGEVQ